MYNLHSYHFGATACEIIANADQCSHAFGDFLEFLLQRYTCQCGISFLTSKGKPTFSASVTQHASCGALILLWHYSFLLSC